MSSPALPVTYGRSMWLFRRLAASCYLLAFVSLAPQLPGLIGERGIQPAGEYLDEVAAWSDATGVGLDRYRQLPTLAWLNAGDRLLQALAVGGAVLSALVTAGIAPLALFPILWAAYLSLTIAAGEFLAFQWDSLLLETGVLAALAAPRALIDRWSDAPDPPWPARWLTWWLLFRLMLGSGLAKLVSGDPSWRDLSALAAHYETQPLPTPLAWYAAQLPMWVHAASTAAVLAIELAVPWLLIAGTRPRRLAALVFAVLQAGIALTGNYAYFNLLTIALCITLLDDRVFTGLIRTPSFARGGRLPNRAGRLLGHAGRLLGRASQLVGRGGRLQPARPSLWPSAAAAIVIVPVSAGILAGQAGLPVPTALQELRSAIAPLRSVNRYGLFAVMTRTRPEIVIEGSSDGTRWQAYEFRHKPGPLTRAPSWVAPMQPRLDWQMWFAALGRYEEEIWFQRLCQRLLEGSSSVTGLFARNPFPTLPPRVVRARLYRYRFTTSGEGAGAWWTRELLQEYMPATTQEGVASRPR
jgi:hypothetical protein